jgi:hypothetical protein
MNDPLFSKRSPKRPQPLAPTLLGIWLIIHGLQMLVPAFSFTMIARIVPALALVAGAMILLER